MVWACSYVGFLREHGIYERAGSLAEKCHITISVISFGPEWVTGLAQIPEERK